LSLEGFAEYLRVADAKHATAQRNAKCPRQFRVVTTSWPGCGRSIRSDGPRPR